jgi:RimJ/RimL family protein N-acetyltransferase
VTDVAGVIAIPYQHNDPEKIRDMLDKACEHRPWFDDYTWENPEARRTAASKYLANAFMHGRLWEVWDGAKLVGVLMLDEVRYRTDARCHFIFFDRKLANKRQLCLNVMRWAFDQLELHRLSCEIPIYARALASFARKKLGFRYEMEARQPSWPKGARPLNERLAELGSRRYQAVLYKGSWEDVLLLSTTRKEFDDFYERTQPRTGTAVEGGEATGSGSDGPDSGLRPESEPVPAATDAPDERTPATSREHI